MVRRVSFRGRAPGFRVARTFLFVLAVAAAVGVGCALPDFEKVRDEGTGGAGAGCDHALPPKRPTSGDPRGTLDLVFAMKMVDLGDTDPPNRPGIDLDRTCTCGEPRQEGQCVIPPFVMGGTIPCDPADGRDNAVVPLIQESKTALMQGSPEFTAAIAQGKWSLLVRVSEYDGSPNDSSVSLAVYVTSGLAAPPLWDGNDAWPVRAESLANATDENQPLIVDPNAYVVDGQLVGVISGELDINTTLKVRLASGFLTGKLVSEGGVWRIDDGLLAGTWLANEALKAVGNLTISNVPLCTLGPSYAVVRSIICNNVDIASAPTLPCDSLSFGMRMTAEAAKLGAITPAQPLPPVCPADQCGGL